MPVTKTALGDQALKRSTIKALRVAQGFYHEFSNYMLEYFYEKKEFSHTQFAARLYFD